MFKFLKKKKFWYIAVPVMAVLILAIVLLSVFLPPSSGSFLENDGEPIDKTRFPKNFLFGTATSSYQIEGGWDKDGKGKSIWDIYTHSRPEDILEGANGDVAANSYEFYSEDVKILKQIGVHFYRFSISWPRVLPAGDTSFVNIKGLEYYDKLINELLENGIEPMVTLYHWDLPQALQDIGGWTNVKIVDYFEEYARVIFDRYSHLVKYFITINEPMNLCDNGYGHAMHAPKINSSGIGSYLCGHHVLLAHSRAYHLYKNEYNSKDGQIGIAIHGFYTWPKNEYNPKDIEAVKRKYEFKVGWFMHPIFSPNGDYPALFREIIDRNSEMENYRWSRLPKFTSYERILLKGSADFLGLNYYSSGFSEPDVDLESRPKPSYERDEDVTLTYNESWPVAKSDWLYSIPEGLTELLKHIHTEYNGPNVIITENGWSDDGQLNDRGRIIYLQEHLQAILNAIWDHGCNVIGYTYWSLLDSFEWNQGYTEKFGLVHVNFDSEKKERTPKDSARVYRNIIETRSIPKTDALYPDKDDVTNEFPKRFIFGSATSSYQIEGAWDKDGRGPSIWDDYCQNFPENIHDGSNGNIASNSYEMYKEDVKALKDVGVQFYRFSISWSRVLPDGDISSRNEQGLLYYDNLINELIANDINPMITMYHWDLPSSLQEIGGWANPKIIDYFVEYARLLLDKYGDRVKTWSTFNEPNVFCILGYGTNSFAPGVDSNGGEYLCMHHVLLAHAKVYRMYRQDYFFNGFSMGIVINSFFDWPKDANNLNDRLAANQSMAFWTGSFMHPIFSKTGDYPPIMREIIDRNSKKENLKWSRLPVFTKAEIELIKGSSDYFGLNTYTGRYAEFAPDNFSWPNTPFWASDCNVLTTQDDKWPTSESAWLRFVPESMREILNWIKNEYNNPDVLITENGWSDKPDEIKDTGRIRYMNHYLQAVLDAIWKDGCRVVGYTQWSIIDNFEWTQGYTARFGLYHVNFDNDSKKRTAKDSVSVYRNIIETRQVQMN